jgi:hypothetical protein
MNGIKTNTESGSWTPMARQWRSRLRGTPAVALMFLALPLGALAQGRAWTCSNDTLNGDYGAVVQGIRAINAPGTPLATEAFVGISLRRFDGKGGFMEAAASQHGAVTGVFPTLGTPGAATGTYQVNPDCTGTSTLVLPFPFPAIKSDFVIVDNGKGVREVVTSPKDNVVTAVFTKL